MTFRFISYRNLTPATTHKDSLSWVSCRTPFYRRSQTPVSCRHCHESYGPPNTWQTPEQQMGTLNIRNADSAKPNPNFSIWVSYKIKENNCFYWVFLICMYCVLNVYQILFHPPQNAAEIAITPILILKQLRPKKVTKGHSCNWCPWTKTVAG